MDWISSGHKYKAPFVKDILAEMGDRVIDHALVGNHLWTVFRDDSSGKLMVGLHVLEKQYGRWCRKTLDESMHPYYYDCPLWIIKAADAPVSEKAAEWRNAVAKWRKEKAKDRKRLAQLVPGAILEVDSHRLKLIEHVGRRGWIAASLSNPNSTYLIKTAHAKQWLVPGAAA
jgi:hypothetical protein